MKGLRTALNELYDRMWDARLGISTIGTDFGPTPYRLITNVFERLQLDADDHLIDFGSGRGRVVCYAARYPVARVAGVEIDEIAVTDARRNIARLRQRAARDVSVSLGSAGDFDCANGTVFYFANPFEETVFEKVLSNVRAAIGSRTNKARIVYYNPMRRTVLDSLDWLAPPEVLFTSHSGAPAVLLYRPKR